MPVEMGIPETRLQLIRILHRHETRSVPELSAELHCSVSGLRKHIGVLETLGMVESVVVKTDGSFRPVRLYRLNPARVEEVAWSLYDSILQPD